MKNSMLRYTLPPCYPFSLQCRMDFIKKHYVLLLASGLFMVILGTHYPFHKAIILLLEFIVIIEVVKMIGEFIEKKRLRLRYILDVFIIFLIRDVIILTTHSIKPYEDILFLILIILIFFGFRFLAVQYSPTAFKKTINIIKKRKKVN